MRSVLRFENPCPILSYAQGGRGRDQRTGTRAGMRGMISRVDRASGRPPARCLVDEGRSTRTDLSPTRITIMPWELGTGSIAAQVPGYEVLHPAGEGSM